MLRRNKKGNVISIVPYIARLTKWMPITVDRYLEKYPELKNKVEEIIFKHEASMATQVVDLMREQRELAFIKRHHLELKK